MKQRRTVRRASVLLPLLLALTGGCLLGEKQRAPCDCPNSEAIVLNIDWFGDGSVAARFDSQEFEEGWLDVGLLFDHFSDADDASTALDGLYARLVTAGLMEQIPPGDPNGVSVDLPDASVVILPPLVETNTATDIGVEVSVFADDAQANHALQPLVDALGTID